MNKRTVLIILAISMAVLLGSCTGNAGIPAAPSAQPSAVPSPDTSEAPSPAPVVMISESAPAPVAESIQAEEPAPAPEAAPGSPEGCTVEAKGYRIDVLSAEKGTDGSGNPIVIVKYLYTNSNPSAASFWEISRDSISQGGAVLSGEGIAVSDPAFFAFTTPISSGDSVQVQFAYYVRDLSAPVDVKISVYDRNSGSSLASGSCSLVIR